MTESLILRIVHVVGGIFWVGSALFTFLFLVPSLGALGPAAGTLTAELQRRRFFTLLPAIAILTILSGLRLLMIGSGSVDEYFATPTGRTLSMSGGVAILAFVIGFFVSRPLSMRIGRQSGELAQAADETTRSRLALELAALRKRSTLANLATAVLLLVASIGMAVARYVG